MNSKSLRLKICLKKFMLFDFTIKGQWINVKDQHYFGLFANWVVFVDIKSELIQQLV